MKPLSVRALLRRCRERAARRAYRLDPLSPAVDGPFFGHRITMNKTLTFSVHTNRRTVDGFGRFFTEEVQWTGHYAGCRFAGTRDYINY